MFLGDPLVDNDEALSRRSTNKDKTYFLSYRDTAKVCDGLSHQEAHTITFALASLGVIKIVSKGDAGLNGRKAAESVSLAAKQKSKSSTVSKFGNY